MKKLKKICCWILISVLVQGVLLSYINFIYLPGRVNVRVTMYESESATVKNRSFKLPDEARDVTVSYDGLYVAYRHGNDLSIADISKRKTVKTLNPPGGSFTCLRWLPDRDMLVYSIKEPEKKRGQVRISTYDIGSDLERSYPDITSLPEGSEIIDIELSPLTNIVYSMIKINKTKAKLYRFDIMDNLKFIMDTDISTVIKETMYTDSLIYQLSDGRIRIRNGKTGKSGRIPVKEAKLLLHTDENDLIYTGATDKNGRLTAIFFGKAGQQAEKWETLILEQPLSATDAFITAEGAVYVADRQSKRLQALKGTGVTEYQGGLLTVLNDYAVSMDRDKLLLKVLKK